jgi:hypothetical protein
MRGFIKVVAGIAIAVSSIAIVTGLVGIFTQNGKEQAQAATVFGSGLAGILFSGIAWVLVDIANALSPGRPTVQDTNLPSMNTPDALRQKLSGITDKELRYLSYNTSRGLPEYQMIMDEINKRAKAS